MSKAIPPNLRILKIIEIISQSDSALSPTEINDTLGWPKPSLHRLCKTLIDEGYVENRGRKLYPRQRLFNLFSGLAVHDVPQIARHQILLRVSTEVNETVNFVRPETKGMFYSSRIETNWPFRIQLPAGTHVPFHCTASGKTFLASLRGKKRKIMLDSLSLTAFTDHTHVSIATLSVELDKIAEQGYALDREEFHDNMSAIAVPVYNNEGRFHAALAIHGPLLRFTYDIAISKIEMLKKEARNITQTILT